MKMNLIGMILNNAGRRCFDGAILDDNGRPMPAAESLHHMIMEYAKVVNGGTSDIVTTSREVLTMAPNAGGNATERSEGRVDHNVGRHFGE